MRYANRQGFTRLIPETELDRRYLAGAYPHLASTAAGVCVAHPLPVDPNELTRGQEAQPWEQ